MALILSSSAVISAITVSLDTLSSASSLLSYTFNGSTSPEEPYIFLHRTLHQISIRKGNCTFQLRVFRNLIQLIPQAVNFFISTTRVLLMTVSNNYALIRQLHLFDLNYLAQLDLLLVKVYHGFVTSRCDLNPALIGSAESNDIRRVLLLAMHEIVFLSTPGAMVYFLFTTPGNLGLIKLLNSSNSLYRHSVTTHRFGRSWGRGGKAVLYGC